MRHVAGTEETFDANKEVRVMFTPKHAAAVAKVVFDTFSRLIHRFDDEKAAAHVKRALLVGQRHSLLGTQRVAAGRGVVLHVSTRRLINEPLAYVAFVCIGFLREFRGSERAVCGQSFVKAEFLADVGE